MAPPAKVIVKNFSCSLAHFSQGYNSSYGNICSYCFHANSRVGDMGKYFPIAPTLSRRRGKVLSYSSYSWGLRDMQPSPISLLIKREFVIFERVPVAQPGFEPGTFCLEGECLIHYSIEEVMLKWVWKDNIYTQRSLRDRPRAQGHILSRLAFLKYLNYLKIAGLRPAIFRGTSGNWGHP